ncbi:MAG: type II secretion system secretin GspD [Gammaproteobacteria bacterium]|nr:type II secretion system secretin GspD [Gammaproteobacteria bacterium]
MLGLLQQGIRIPILQSGRTCIIMLGISLGYLTGINNLVEAADLKPLEDQKTPAAQQSVNTNPAPKIEKLGAQAQGNPGNKQTGAVAGTNLPLAEMAKIRAEQQAQQRAAKSATPNNARKPAQKKKSSPARPVEPAKVVSTGGNEMLFNFQDADVKAVIKTISQITGKNFILDPRVKGKISIISAKPVSKKAAYRIFLSALRAQGFTISELDQNTVKIIPVGEGKQDAGRFYSRWQGEQMVSQVVVVQHGNATELVPLLRPLMAPTSQLSAYTPANALIITDYASNIGTLMDLLKEIDQPVSTDVTIIPLEHASALDMAELVSQLMAQHSGGGAPGIPKGAAAVGSVDARTSIVPDLRTNSLLVRSDNPGSVAQIRKLIERLDVPAKTEGNTRVIYLKNAEAKKLADILRGLLEAGAIAGAPSSGGPRGRPGTAQAAPAGAPKSMIQADEDTNSLIINASDAVYNNLRGVIDKLDARRAQVFVEALIVEISSKDAIELGFQWMGGRQAGNQGGVIGGMANYGNPSIAAASVDPTALGASNGLTLAYLGPEIILPDGRIIRGLGGLARALETANQANILSTPTLLTLDNAEAKIVVGQNVPFLTGSFSNTGAGGGTGGSVNPFQTIERKDVGLTLEIKPQITEGGGVKMEIKSEVSSVNSAATGLAQDLITNKRTLETTVVIEDRSTVVLGGLIEDTADEGSQGVPILSRIPILGWLFKYQKKEKNKTNLMVFLKPTIIRDAKGSTSYTQNRYDYIMRQQDDIGLLGDDHETLKSFSPKNNPEPKTEDERLFEKSQESEYLGPPEDEGSASSASETGNGREDS